MPAAVERLALVSTGAGDRSGVAYLPCLDRYYAFEVGSPSGRYEVFKEYTQLVDQQSENLATLRGLFSFKSDRQPIPIESGCP